MKRHVLMYGLIGGILIALLQWTEYQFLVVEHSIEIDGGLIAATFAVLGIWLGLKLTAKRQTIVVREIPVPADGPFIPDERRRENLHITRRELEILELIAQGLSNREIAERLFVSESTVRTHSSRVFDKLGARRRTQAVQFGKEFGLLPSRGSCPQLGRAAISKFKAGRGPSIFLVSPWQTKSSRNSDTLIPS
jgi:DNA-binding CsgD family transcriptional regulator